MTSCPKWTTHPSLLPSLLSPSSLTLSPPVSSPFVCHMCLHPWSPVMALLVSPPSLLCTMCLIQPWPPDPLLSWSLLYHPLSAPSAQDCAVCQKRKACLKEWNISILLAYCFRDCKSWWKTGKFKIALFSPCINLHWTQHSLKTFFSQCSGSKLPLV